MRAWLIAVTGTPSQMSWKLFSNCMRSVDMVKRRFKVNHSSSVTKVTQEGIPRRKAGENVRIFSSSLQNLSNHLGSSLIKDQQCYECPSQLTRHRAMMASMTFAGYIQKP